MRWRGFFRPFRAGCFNGVYPRLAPWAALLRRFAAGRWVGSHFSRRDRARNGAPSGSWIPVLPTFPQRARKEWGTRFCCCRTLRMGWFPLGSRPSQPFRKGRGKSGAPDFVVVELSEWVGSHLDPAPPTLSANGAERVGHPILCVIYSCRGGYPHVGLA
jgi:hypothetical protein